MRATKTDRPDIFTKCRNYTRAKEAMAAGVYPYFIPIEGSEDTEVMIDGKRLIMVGSNNYLGLTHHPKVLEAAEAASRRYGTGCTGSRFLNGTLDLHEKLEADLADFTGFEAALVFSTGYQTNLGIIQSLVGRDDTVLVDKLDHASILDGCQMSQGETVRFRHNDIAGPRPGARAPAGQEGRHADRRRRRVLDGGRHRAPAGLDRGREAARRAAVRRRGALAGRHRPDAAPAPSITSACRRTST